MSVPVAINPITGSPTVFFSLVMTSVLLLTHVAGVVCDGRGGEGELIPLLICGHLLILAHLSFLGALPSLLSVLLTALCLSVRQSGEALSIFFSRNFMLVNNKPQPMHLTLNTVLV